MIRMNEIDLHPSRTMPDSEWRKRISGGIRTRAESLRWCSPSPPYGYDLYYGILIPSEDDAKIVRRIFYMRGSQSQSYLIIADVLNAAGIKTRKGNPWSASSIRAIITNEIYIGNFNVAGVHAHIEAYQIVSDAVFRKARETAKLNAKYRNRKTGMGK